MKNYDFKPNIEGVVIKISDGLKPSYIECKTEMSTVKFKFNKLTRISGCKFKHLAVGDKVLVKKANTKDNFCLQIEILDIVSKWDRILKEDNKYSIVDNLEYGPNSIRPEIITPTIASYATSNAESKLVDILENLKGSSKITAKLEYKVLSLYLEGKTFRGISELVKVSHMTCSRIIKKYVGEV